jgi:hypothetical protein
MSLSFEEMNILGNLTNDSYGRGSTNDYDKQRPDGYTLGGPGQHSSGTTKVSFAGDIMHINSIAIINLGPISHQHQAIASAENELNQHIKAYLSYIKKEFKKKENAGRALKVKQVKNSENTEIDMLNHYASTRRAYVKRTICFEIG